MPNPLQTAGAVMEPSQFAPLRTDRMFTGLYTNRSVFRDAATTDEQEKYGLGRQDSIWGGCNTEISTRLTIVRRPGSSVFNDNTFAPINRFYSFNTFNLTDEAIRVLADTDTDIYDITDGGNTSIFTKSEGAGPTFFLGLGNILYFTDGVENKQWDYDNGNVWNWGIQAPTNAPTVTQSQRASNYASWIPGVAYPPNNPSVQGMLILDDMTNVPSYAKIIPLQGGQQLAILAGTNYSVGAQIALPDGFSNANLMVWASPGYGYNANTLVAGVFGSWGVGGSVNSSFQNDSGSFGFSATTNWIAVAWTGGASPYSGTGYSGIIVHTEEGDTLAFQVFTGYNGININVPSGFSINESLSQCGMVSTDYVNHVFQGVWECYLDGTTIVNLYDDGSGNVWNGETAVFSVFWALGGSITTESVTNGTAVIIPTSGTDTAALVFATIPFSPSGGQWGLPTGYNLSNFAATCAMGGPGPAHASSPGNRGHGWNCTMNGQTNASYIMDSEGNTWAASINVFAVGEIGGVEGGNVQFSPGGGTTGATEPTWNPDGTGSQTQDGTVTWTNMGSSTWQPDTNYGTGSIVMGVVTNPPSTPNQLYVATTPGTSGAVQPVWQGGVNTQINDGSTLVWTCLGNALDWSGLGADTQIESVTQILDPNGYLQGVWQYGKSGEVEPDWQELIGALTTDNTVTWDNIQAFAPAGTAAVQYGYEYENTQTGDLSEMSPASTTITVMQGNNVVVQGQGSGDAQVGRIIIFRTAQGGSTFLQIGTVINPGAGQTWTWTDNTTDADLNTEWQAQVNGQGTPLPIGATCLAYHAGRIWAGVGNVVYGSAGPDAVAAESSGNAGFDTTFTVQSLVTCLWACSLGLVVFTVRDAYIILGSGTANDPFYCVVFCEDLPLKSYDCFTVFKTTPYILLGNNMLVQLDPSNGLTEVGFPIADRLAEEFDPSASYVTMHSQSSAETALYVANGVDHWYRMNQNNSPEAGSAWSPRAVPASGGIGCVQSVEIAPGEYRLLLSGTTPGPILMRDITTNSDNGNNYPALTLFGSIVLALPGQLAGLHFITLESLKVGTRASLTLLLGELSGEFEPLVRTRQDPTNLPPSETIYSDRYHFKQNQKTAWCRHFQMAIAWPEEDEPNELLAFTVFGETWQEMRAQ